MRRATLIVFACVLLLASLGGAGAAVLAKGRPSRPLAKRVIVVLMTGMSWRDLQMQQGLGARSVFESGWAANINVPTLGRARTAARVLTSLGAGTPADADVSAGEAMNAGEPFENGRAGDAYVRRTGRFLGSTEVVHEGIAELQRLNSGLPEPVRPGLMGSVVESLGRATAVLGNSDTVLHTTPDVPDRSGAVVAMDEAGRVAYGDVGPDTLLPESQMAYGVRASTGTLLNRLNALPDKVGLVVIDAGDPLRAARYAKNASPAAQHLAKAAAMERASELLQRLVQWTGKDSAIVVVSPVAEDGGTGPAAPTPFSIVVPGQKPGYATSGSTRRPGLVAGQDLIATVRYVLSGDPAQPPGVPGRVIVRSDGPMRPDLALLARQSARHADVDRGRPPILFAWFVLGLVGVLVAVMLLVSRRSDETLSRLTEALLLWLVTLPLSGFLLGWLWPFALSTRQFIVLSVAPSVILAASLSLSRLRPSRQLFSVLTLTAGVIALDQLLGPIVPPRLAMGTLLGYSPIDGGRYYGMGNEAWAVLLAAVALAVGLWLDQDRGGWERRKSYVAGGFVALAFLVGLPSFGANLGGFVSVAAALATMWLGWDGKRPTAGWVAAAVLAVFAGAVALVAVDLARAPTVATHVAGAARQIGGGGLPAIQAIAGRTLATNLAVFGRTPLVWLLLLIVAALVVERRRPAGLAAAFVAERPKLATALTGLFVGGVVGVLVEDTGITIAALLVAVALPSVLLLMLSGARRRREAAEA